MLTSQTSSSSLPSAKNGEAEKNGISALLPEKFKTNCLFARKVVSADVIILITSNFELIECKGREVVNYINLKCHLPAEPPTCTSVDFDVIIQQGRKCRVVYALKIHSVLLGLERKASQIRVLKVLTGVKSFNLTLDVVIGQAAFRVTHDDGKEILTNFVDSELGCLIRNEKFASIHESATRKTKAASLQLANLNDEIEKLSLRMHEDRKLLPKLMLEEVSELVLQFKKFAHNPAEIPEKSLC